MRVRPTIVVCISLALTLAAAAEVSVHVYRCDGQTPLAPRDPNIPDVYSDIMVGTRLVLILSSDMAKDWSGSLLLTAEDWERGTLTGRGFDPGMLSYQGSCLQAAGIRPTAMLIEWTGDINRIGFDLLADGHAVAGDWFILDYHANEVGTCNVDLIDYAVSLDLPLQTLALTHVPSRDFNADSRVNFADFSLLASQWGDKTAPAAEAPSALDLDGDGVTGPVDLALFSEYWLERADCNEPTATLETHGLGL